MAVSTTSFTERLGRIEAGGGTVQLFAGNGAAQRYSADNLICAKPKMKKTYWMSVIVGVMLGAFAGYMFKTYVGIEMFFAQPLPTLYAVIKADHMTAGICLAMIIGPIGALGSLIFSRTKARMAQFWWAYVMGAVGANLTTWYYFYLTLTAGA